MGGSVENFSMSNLYIRVMTGFYSHRKTVKLRIKLGLDAFWIPPRLWAYAAENQPDGDLSGYTSEELAELLGCSRHAQAMLQALKDSGFVDENGMIHDWSEHNGYHKSFSLRAKKAAEARWAKEKSPRPPKEETGNRTVERGDKHCPSNAPSINGHQKPNLSPTERIGKEKALKRIESRVSEIKGQFPLRKGDKLLEEFDSLKIEGNKLIEQLGYKA